MNQNVGACRISDSRSCGGSSGGGQYSLFFIDVSIQCTGIGRRCRIEKVDREKSRHVHYFTCAAITPPSIRVRVRVMVVGMGSADVYFSHDLLIFPDTGNNS